MDVRSLAQLEERLGTQRVQAERLELAHLFKFLSQDFNPHVRRRLPYEGVSFRSYHRQHRKAIAKLHFLLTKYGIDAEAFIRHALTVLNVYTPELAVTAKAFRSYADELTRQESFRKISASFERTVGRLAEECVRRDVGPREYLRDVISSGRLAYEYFSGRISKYYLASLRNFREIYSVLDPLSKSELRIIYDAAEELSAMANDSMLATSGTRARPIAAVEAEIQRIKNKSSQENTTNQETN